MTENTETLTDRARRREAVESGARETAIDRLNPRGRSRDSGSQTSRQRQEQTARDVADQIEIDRGGVGTVERLTGLDVFLRSEGESQFGDRLQSEFASEADFVTPGDVNPNVDPEAISAQPAVAEGRRDDVADRARSQTASDAQFIKARDLDAEVGPRGVQSVAVAEGRRDAVAARTRQGLASEDPFAEPGDFMASVGPGGITDAGLTDSGARQRASRQFESQTGLGDVDPTADVEPADEGFALDSEAQRRAAARGFEDQFALFDAGELDPSADVRTLDDGFGLGSDPARELAAQDLDSQLDEVNVSPDDVELTPTDSGFEAVFETEVSR